ncbi:MAG TPA: hypothetical protein VLX59_00315 [Acidimicrobiales bacterium]|nr:hypothetical protein [Acidimicrobiales bacterium]
MRKLLWPGALVAALAPVALSLPAVAAASTTAPARRGPVGHHGYSVRQILLGSDLSHTFTPAGSTVSRTEPLTDPDDITRVGDDIFVGFQNGVGPQGEPSADGNLDSTVVEISRTGKLIAQWDVKGKTDGVTADPAARDVIATVNEDADSSL